MLLRYQGSVIYEPMMSLIKVAHQTWHDYPFTQRNKAAKSMAVLGLCECGSVWGVEGWSKFEKEVIRQRRESS